MNAFLCRRSLGIALLAAGLAAMLLLDSPSGLAAGPFGGRRARLHPWGRFGAHSQKQVRIVTTTYRDDKVLSSTESNLWTELLDVNNDWVELQLRGHVVIDGRQVSIPEQQVKESFFGDSGPLAEDAADVRIEELAEQAVLIDGVEYACQVERVTSTRDDVTTTVTTWTNEETPPFVLKREAVTKRRGADDVLGRTQMRVEALNVSREVMRATKPTAKIKVTHSYPGGEQVTEAYTCLDVPGGIVAHSYEERDPEGRVTRRSTLELIDYAVK